MLEIHTNHGDHPGNELNVHRPTVILPTVSVPYNIRTGNDAVTAAGAVGEQNTLNRQGV